MMKHPFGFKFIYFLNLQSTSWVGRDQEAFFVCIVLNTFDASWSGPGTGHSINKLQTKLSEKSKTSKHVNRRVADLSNFDGPDNVASQCIELIS